MNKILYKHRPLSKGFPDIERLGVDYYKDHQIANGGVEEIMHCMGKVIDLQNGLRTVCVVGCGPKPESLRELLESGYAATGIEPVQGSAVAARDYLEGKGAVLCASAEKIPLPNESQRVVILESVLEHVDSPEISLSEIYRILAPGGILYVYTTNRHKFSLTGKNQEFNVRYYNTFPSLVKECYVHEHLHYNPKLSNFTPRPAVHWFTYMELCNLGRRVGFARFYSLLDMAGANSRFIGGRRSRKLLVALARKNPWLRALALTQCGSSIFMYKRSVGA